jgi:hypothetical protein
MFVEEHHEINGIDTAVLTAGEGPPIVFFHGAGTATGFDALLPLAGNARLIVPNHPGFGASADDPSIDSVQDSSPTSTVRPPSATIRGRARSAATWLPPSRCCSRGACGGSRSPHLGLLVPDLTVDSRHPPGCSRPGGGLRPVCRAAAATARVPRGPRARTASFAGRRQAAVRSEDQRWLHRVAVRP